MPLYLPILFFATALTYAMVGFGGGSTYNALLALSGADYRIFPVIALLCNIIVVSGGVWRYGQAGHIALPRLAPFLYASVPAAWIGGALPISEALFTGLLGLSLLLAGIRLLTEPVPHTPIIKPYGLWFPLSCGAGLGLLAGLVGIGGGIFLAPLLYLTRWGSPHQIAGSASLFILVNSLAGLAGQIAKRGVAALMPEVAAYSVLFLTVLLGGQIGSRLGSRYLPPMLVRRLTALLILYVSTRLLWRWLRTGTASPV